MDNLNSPASRIRLAAKIPQPTGDLREKERERIRGHGCIIIGIRNLGKRMTMEV